MKKQELTKEEFVQKVQAAKRAMASRCQQIAKKYTPPDYQVVYRKSLSGSTCQEAKTIHAPKPTTRKSLYIYLHECAHVVLNHNGRKPRHVEEMEAEKWAQETMRREGIPVPRSMTRSGKMYVARKIDQALRRGAKKIDREARRYAQIG